MRQSSSSRKPSGYIIRIERAEPYPDGPHYAYGLGLEGTSGRERGIVFALGANRVTVYPSRDLAKKAIERSQQFWLSGSGHYAPQAWTHRVVAIYPTRLNSRGGLAW